MEQKKGAKLMDLIPKNHLAFVVMKNQLWFCGLQSRKDLNLSQSEWKLMRSTYTIFSVKNKTRRGQMES